LTSAPPDVRLDEAGKKVWYLTRSLHSTSSGTLAPAAASTAETQGASVDEFDALVESAASDSHSEGNDVQQGKSLPQVQLIIRPASAARCPRCWIHRSPSPLVACDRCLGIMHKKEVGFANDATYLAQGVERTEKADGDGQAAIVSKVTEEEK
jgi:hypothetical protein